MCDDNFSGTCCIICTSGFFVYHFSNNHSPRITFYLPIIRNTAMFSYLPSRGCGNVFNKPINNCCANDFESFALYFYRARRSLELRAKKICRATTRLISISTNIHFTIVLVYLIYLFLILRTRKR